MDRPFVPDDLTPALNRALAEEFARVRRLDLADGRRFWLKRAERPGWRMRLQKGDPLRALQAERAGLKALAAQGLPVAAIAAEGPDWLLLPDAGPTLTEVDVGAQGAAFAAAGRALGRLHWAGLVHGRPAVRDICWDGQEVRFIDLERFRPGRRGGFWQAADVVMFVQTCMTRWPEDRGRVGAALVAYAANSPPGAMERVRRLARVLAPLGWLAGALLRLRPASRELRAVGLTLACLRG